MYLYLCLLFHVVFLCCRRIFYTFGKLLTINHASKSLLKNMLREIKYLQCYTFLLFIKYSITLIRNNIRYNLFLLLTYF